MRVMKHYEGFRNDGKTLCGIPIVDEGVVGNANRYKRRHVRPSKVTKDRELVTCRQCLRNHGMGVIREDEQ